MIIIAASLSHDASLCLLINGEIKYFMKEERLSRIKRDHFINCAAHELSSIIDSPVDVVLIHRLENTLFDDNYNTGVYFTVENYFKYEF